MPEFKSWLIRGDNNTAVKCRACAIPRNKIELPNMGKQALKSHASGKKNCERLALNSQTSRISFTPICKSQPPPPCPPLQTSDNSSKIPTLDSYVMSDSLTDAEIRWPLKMCYLSLVMACQVYSKPCSLIRPLLRSFLYRKTNVRIISTTE